MPLDLDTIRQRWAGVAWTYGEEQRGHICISAFIAEDGLRVLDLDGPDGDERSALSRAAAAPGDIEALITEVERLRTALNTIGTTIYTQGRGTKVEQELLVFIREQLGRA